MVKDKQGKECIFMIMEKFLIGESGGTKTDWVLLEGNEIIGRYVTESYHPNNHGDDFWSRVADFWNSLDVSYGMLFTAGCYREEPKKKTKEAFSKLGLNVSVCSDIQAASFALFGIEGSGWGAILGTGSVVFKTQSGTVTELYGGKGHLAGDEGSGYYFGRLVIEAFNSEKLTALQEETFLSKIKVVPDLKDKFSVASIASELTDDLELFQEYHERNIELFIKSTLNKNTDRIEFVGSYAFYIQEVIKQKLASNQIQHGKFIERPIGDLVDLMVASNDLLVFC